VGNRIASKDEVPVSRRIREQLDSGIEVDRSYNGPRLDYVDGNDGRKEARITQEFVDEMLKHFREGNTLHRRYAWEVVLGAQRELLKHESLVEIEVPEGETADV
jgi:serine/threonine-protein phosphatase 5